MADDDTWTIRTALEWTQGYLDRKGDENPRVSAQWLMSEACGLSRIELYANFDRPLSLDERDVLRDYVARRGRGEPLQYITGEVGFRHITIQVRPGVLIPRPETEVLVSEALSLLPERLHAENVSRETLEPQTDALPERFPTSEANVSRETISCEETEGSARSAAGAAVADDERPSERFPTSEANVSRETFSCEDGAKPGRPPERDANVSRETLEPQDDAQESAPLLVADLCTGTGCVACSIAYEHPRVRVVATDTSPEAVKLARENVHQLGQDDRVQVIECDLGEGIPRDLMGTFDLVVSNPPYIPTGLLADVPREVGDFEPTLALDGGADGLDVVRRMLPWCARALKPGGGLALELFEETCDAAAELVRNAGFEDVRIVNDLAGRPRVLVARQALQEETRSTTL